MLAINIIVAKKQIIIFCSCAVKALQCNRVSLSILCFCSFTNFFVIYKHVIYKNDIYISTPFNGFKQVIDINTAFPVIES